MVAVLHRAVTGSRPIHAVGRVLMPAIAPTKRWASGAANQECYIEQRVGDDSGIAVLTLNRPATKNALGRRMLDEFRAALMELRFNSAVRVVVVRSTVDRVFCAGADLKERATMPEAEVAGFVHGLRTAFNDLESLPMPTIAAIDGAALGGGLELAMACDLRGAGPLARVGLPETKLAIIPGAGGTQRISRLVGISKAKMLIFTGKELNAAEASQIGLVDFVAESSAYDDALELARKILPQGPVALRMAKIAISQGAEMDKASGMILEQQCYAQVIPTKDRLEGLQAFKDKRKPVYIGR